MKKLFIVLLVALSYSLSFAEDYAPDQLGKNYDEKTVTLTTTCIAPLTAGWEGVANLINDVIDGTVRVYGAGAGIQGDAKVTGAAGHMYSLTFTTEVTHASGLKIKGVWMNEAGAVVPPSDTDQPGETSITDQTGETFWTFKITEVDATATGVVPASYAFQVPVTVEYTDI